MEETRFKKIRQDLGISHEGLARRTRSLTSKTIKNAEEGRRVNFDSATQILAALNAVLSEVGQETVTLADLDIKIR